MVGQKMARDLVRRLDVEIASAVSRETKRYVDENIVPEALALLAAQRADLVAAAANAAKEAVVKHVASRVESRLRGTAVDATVVDAMLRSILR